MQPKTVNGFVDRMPSLLTSLYSVAWAYLAMQFCAGSPNLTSSCWHHEIRLIKSALNKAKYREMRWNNEEKIFFNKIFTILYRNFWSNILLLWFLANLLHQWKLQFLVWANLETQRLKKKPHKKRNLYYYNISRSSG